MIDAGGPDHLSVGVRIPGGRFQRPILGRNLYIIPAGKVEYVSKTSVLSFLVYN